MYEETSSTQAIEGSKKVVNRTPQKYLDNKVALSESFQKKYPTEYNEAIQASDIAKQLHRLHEDKAAEAMAEMPETCKLCGGLPMSANGRALCSNSSCVLHNEATSYESLVAWNKAMAK